MFIIINTALLLSLVMIHYSILFFKWLFILKTHVEQNVTLGFVFSMFAILSHLMQWEQILGAQINESDSHLRLSQYKSEIGNRINTILRCKY